MIIGKYGWLLEKIKNRRLLVIVWDVVNNNMTPATIEVAQELRRAYFRHEIDAPDLVKAVAGWNPETLRFANPSTLETMKNIRFEIGINQPELETLIGDMSDEIVECMLAAYHQRNNDIYLGFKFQQ